VSYGNFTKFVPEDTKAKGRCSVERKPANSHIYNVPAKVIRFEVPGQI
jgi:hypothetical protein